MTPESALRTFAQLSGGGPKRRTDVVDDIRLFHRQRYKALGVFSGDTVPVAQYPPRQAQRETESPEDRLLSAAALHKNEQLLRIGWLWFAGTIKKDSKSVRYCFPALSIPVERAALQSAFGANKVRPIGDTFVSNLIGSPEVSDRVSEEREFGGGALVDYVTDTGEYQPLDPKILPRLTRLMTWATSIASEVGFTIDETFAVHEASPIERRSKPGIALHVCSAMYMDKPAPTGDRRESLLRLAELSGLGDTAFAQVYSPSTVSPKPADPVEVLRPLSRRQRQVATEIVSQPLAVVSGAPGTGKSHVLTVAALDAVARGKSVLVGASSPHAVDVLVEHFARTPGPTPVAFGGSVHGKQLASELASLMSTHSETVSSYRVADEHDELLSSVEWMLELEQVGMRIDRDPAYRLRTTDDLSQAGDLAELERILNNIEKGGLAGWWARLRQETKLQRRLGVKDGSTDRRARLAELRQLADSQSLLASGGLSLTSTFDRLIDLEDTASEQRGAQLTARWLAGINGAQRKALINIASALRAFRGERRRALAKLDPEDLVRAAPLWVGSVRDIGAVLPAVPAMFDLVILDESSQIDQINAANALVRAKRAIICGDPHQLGHVSFVSDDNVEVAAATHGSDPEVVNPRKRSTFDVASSNAPTQVLDEHFRSAPHLIGFSARKIYNNSIHVATRHPSNEVADHIDIRYVTGERGADKVNHAEVSESIRVADELIQKGWINIGFVSPFRAQADALEDAILAKYRLDQIEKHELRVGTVHSFQGDERRTMIASLAIGESEGAGAWRFVNQQNLFNVMVTRARDRMIILTSTPEPPGLTGDYIRWAEPLPGFTDDVEVSDPWVKKVAAALVDAGVGTRLGYRSGRYVIDIVIGAGSNAIAVDCSPHADGPAAHIDRALQLRRIGWQTADAYQTRWGTNVGQVAVELANRYHSSCAT